jgi:signal transduction histidine kinase
MATAIDKDQDMVGRLVGFRRGYHSPLEQRFQREYFARVAPAIRLAAVLVILLLFVMLLISGRAPAPYDLAVVLPQSAFWLGVFALTFSRRIACTWQPIIVCLGLVSAVLVLSRLATILSIELAYQQPVGDTPLNEAQQKFYYVVQFCVLLASMAALRLQLRWATLLYGGVAAIGLWAFRTRLPAPPSWFMDIRFALLPALVIVFVLLIAAAMEEHLARRYFIVSLQLEAERDVEVRQREQTEGKLKVLGQAIGTIVHDLGNPLTSVQTGAGVLEEQLEKNAGKEKLQKLIGIVLDGAKMLNFMRLSLMEQTRVLEGKPIPVQLKPESLRAIIDTALRYQKPGQLRRQEIIITGEDRQILADQMKMITVLMNLIGNALKYSDGPIAIEWREHKASAADTDRKLIIAILDHGIGGKGITREQASELFTPFGRLDTHAEIEGSGLGLLSVRRIAEAHGGEAYIEGYTDGTPNSPHFSTAANSLSQMLAEPYRTAFIITCSTPAERL